jgi:hypothetical protein
MRVRKDGSRFLASLTFTALHDPAGDLRGISEFSHDLTESKKSAVKYRGVIGSSPGCDGGSESGRGDCPGEWMGTPRSKSNIERIESSLLKMS